MYSLNASFDIEYTCIVVDLWGWQGKLRITLETSQFAIMLNFSLNVSAFPLVFENIYFLCHTQCCAVVNKSRMDI